MKRILSIFLIIVLILSVVSSAIAVNLLAKQNISIGKYINDQNEITGSFPFIYYAREDFDFITEDNWNEFLDLSVRPYAFEYNYFLIVLFDGTGIVFPSCLPDHALFCTIDSRKRPEKVIHAQTPEESFDVFRELLLNYQPT